MMDIKKQTKEYIEGITKSQWAGIVAGLLIVVVSLFFIGTRAFFFVFGIGLLVAAFPFVLSVILQGRAETEKEEMFIEFSRNLVESVKAGTPISRSIVNVRNKPYGVLSPHVKKLANQIYLGIPLVTALQVFSKDVQNKTISRAITLIGQAEKAGGDIGEILDSVAKSVSTSDKLKKERRAVISTLIVQGYIIFFVFIIIVLVMQFRVVPMISGISDLGGLGGGVAGLNLPGDGGSGGITPDEISNSFLYLLMIQGFFSGLTIGKLSEGNFKSGVKHSFVLIVASFLISAGANVIFGG